MEVTTEETASWRHAADSVHLPFDESRGLHSQSELFTRLAEWPFSEMTPEDYPLLLSQPYVQLYRKQVVKQADLVLALHWCGESFTAEEKARAFDYYERRTVRDSSLSACTQAIVAAEVGHLELAHDYAYEALLVDLRNLHHNTRDGLHMASMGGGWQTLVAGFGGLRDTDGLAFAPQLPEGITRLQFRLRWGGLRLTVEIHPDEVTYTLRDDGAHHELTFRHEGEEVTVSTDEPLVLPVARRVPLLDRPPQPPGREPAARHRAAGAATGH